MSEGQRIDGRHYAAQAAEILRKVSAELSGLAGAADPVAIEEWQAKIKAMVDDTPVVMERLFLKTQGGTHMAQVSLETVKALANVVEQGFEGQSVDQATGAIAAAMQAVDTEFGGLIHKAKTHIIRMT